MDCNLSRALRNRSRNRSDSWDCEDIGKGYVAVSTLVQEMHNGRKRRLRKLGFNEAEAEAMSALHTRNFM